MVLQKEIKTAFLLGRGRVMDVEELFTRICDRIPDAMVRHMVPGVALGTMCEGREFIKGFGVTNVRHPLPVDEKDALSNRLYNQDLHRHRRDASGRGREARARRAD